MRPLIHIDNGSLDLEFHNENSDLYDELLKRGDNLYEDAYQDFMKGFPPALMEKEDLEFLLNARVRKKERMIELGVPQGMIDNEDYRIAEYAKDLASGNYLRTGPEYEYAEKYEAKRKEWHNSPEKKNLLREICEYNEMMYYQWKYPDSCEDDFYEWKKTLERCD